MLCQLQYKEFLTCIKEQGHVLNKCSTANWLYNTIICYYILNTLYTRTYGFRVLIRSLKDCDLTNDKGKLFDTIT
jgi:hypothetical protein